MRIAIESMRGPHAGSSSTPGLWITRSTLENFAWKAHAYESHPLLLYIVCIGSTPNSGVTDTFNCSACAQVRAALKLIA